jgi:hypothetical protein
MQDNGNTSRFVEHAAQAERSLAKQLTELQVLMTEEQRVGQELDRLVADHRQRLKRLQRAVDVLGGEPRAPAKHRDSNKYTPSDKTLEKVREGLGRIGQGNAHAVAAAVGMNKSSAFASLIELRAREEVRLVKDGGPGLGGGKVYALMPTAEDA